jgi:hypothetical protein
MENILMSNLNDFIGGTSLQFWRSDGIDLVSTNGPYDNGNSIQILGTTSDTHFFGKEWKLHHVPDRRLFKYQQSYEYFDVKLNMSADKTNAPNPGEAVTHVDNLLPTLQAVARCLTFTIYTKRNEADSYTLYKTFPFTSTSFSAFGTPYVLSVAGTPTHKAQLNPFYSASSANSTWQGVSTTVLNFGRLQPIVSSLPSLNESFIETPDEGQFFVKMEWTIDNTAWNNIFSRSYNEVEGIYLSDLDKTVGVALYSGKREYQPGPQG